MPFPNELSSRNHDGIHRAEVVTMLCASAMWQVPGAATKSIDLFCRDQLGQWPSAVQPTQGGKRITDGTCSNKFNSVRNTLRHMRWEVDPKWIDCQVCRSSRFQASVCAFQQTNTWNSTRNAPLCLYFDCRIDFPAKEIAMTTTLSAKSMTLDHLPFAQRAFSLRVISDIS